MLADAHALVRRSMRALLEAEPEFEVVAEAGDLAATIHHVARQRPRVLVLDLGMPDGSSLRAIERLRLHVPVTDIVAATMHDIPAYARRAFDSGARGFVVKDRADSELPDAIRVTARGGWYLSPQISLQPADPVQGDAGAPPR